VPLKLLSSPPDRPFGTDIEPLRVKQGPLVVIAKNDFLAAFSNKLEPLSGIGPVANDIPQAIDAIHLLLFDVGEYRRQGLKVAMNITNDGELH